MKKIIIIGSGFSGLSAASFLAKEGHQVIVVEKNSTSGGRARSFNANGFTFDMGPSWYWMPDVFERYFSCFDKKVSDYYSLQRLDPSYRIYWPDDATDIPADYNEIKILFESQEEGSADKLDKFLQEAENKYEVGMKVLAFKSSLSAKDYLNWSLAKGILRLDVFSSMKKHIRKYFSAPKLIQLLEFPVLFLGALPADIPALYSLMNYADLKLGTWYPDGGMFKIVEAMEKLAVEHGARFIHNVTVKGINVNDYNEATGITFSENGKPNVLKADVIIGAGDYHHMETLLPYTLRNYPESYWHTRKMAPSCLIYYVGVNKKLKNIRHHNLFFDSSFDNHGRDIYETPKWPMEPLFYVCAPSVTDDTVAPLNHENLFFLVPVASGLSGDTEELRLKYFNKIMDRFEARMGEKIRKSIVYLRSYSVSDFQRDYNAFNGNAYGLANTLLQTAILKPAIRNKKVKNIYYCGQLTVPGPGVPPAIISGEVVAKEVIRNMSKINTNKYDKAFS